MASLRRGKQRREISPFQQKYPDGKEMPINYLKKIFLVSTLLITVLAFMVSLTPGAVKLVKGQTIYILCYANIISDIQRIILRANLVIHNTDAVHPITVVRIDHYDTKGALVEKYLSQPLKLNPLAANRIVIKEPKRGDEGAGANFVVQWLADHKVTEPLIESLMVGSLGAQGYSLSSQGRVIQEEGD